MFLALAQGLADRPRLVRALSLLFPTVILLSAIATLIGATGRALRMILVARRCRTPRLPGVLLADQLLLLAVAAENEG